MTADPDAEEPEHVTPYQVDARGAEGVLVGQGSSQINYFFNRTWTDGVAAPPLVSTSGRITSPTVV